MIEEDWGESTQESINLLVLTHNQKKDLTSHDHIIKKDDRTHKLACFVVIVLVFFCIVVFLQDIGEKKELAFQVLLNIGFFFIGLLGSVHPFKRNNT